MAVSEPSSAAADVNHLSRGARLALRRVVMIAWLAIALGFAMEALILTARSITDNHPTSIQVLIELAQGVTWSFFVCAGVGLGTAIANVRASLGGLISAMAAPLAMGIAKGTQKVMASALEVAVKPAILSLTTLGVLRAIEYGILGWTLARLAGAKEQRALHFVMAGAAVGAVFGGGITALTVQTAKIGNVDFTMPQVITTAVNEIVFPMGCALVVYVTLQIGRHMKLIADTKQSAH